MIHPFAQTRVYFQTNDPSEIDALADKLSQRLVEIGVPDYALAYVAAHMASGAGIHVAIARYEPVRLVEILQANQALEEDEDLEYYQNQIPNEDELLDVLEDKVFTLLTNAVISDDLDSTSAVELDESLRTGGWTVFKVRRGGFYDGDDQTSADIVSQLQRYF
jgi:hypothetical protein